MKKTLLLATYDSFLNTGISLIKELDIVNVDIYIRISTENQLSTRQIDLILQNKYSYNTFWLNNFENIQFEIYDLIIISAGNSFSDYFLLYFHNLKKTLKLKTVTLTLFPGIIFGDIDSITSRINSDIILCNNKSDLEIAQGLKKIYNLNIELINYGLVSLQKYKLNDTRKNIYFFDQVKIPDSKDTRMNILKKLIHLAQTFPKKNFYIKSRVKTSEKTVHQNKYPYEELFEEYKEKFSTPINFGFSYETVEECFKQMELGITMSSTVAFEAVHNELSVVLLTDFGIKKDYYNQFFLNSNLMVSFQEIELLLEKSTYPFPNKKFLDLYLNFEKDRKFYLKSKIKELLSIKENYSRNIYTSNKVSCKTKQTRLRKFLLNIVRFLRKHT